MAPPGGPPVGTVSAGIAPLLPGTVLPAAASFTLAPVPSPGSPSFGSQYLLRPTGGAYTIPLDAPAANVGVFGQRIGVPQPMVPTALAAARTTGYDVPTMVQQSLAARTLPAMEETLLQLMAEDPQLVRRLSNSRVDIARLHGANFVLTVASFLGVDQLATLCGLEDPNARLAFVIGITHAAHPLIETVGTVAMNRLAPVSIGGALVSYAGVAEVEGAAHLTVVYRGATQRAVWQAMVQRFFPEGVSASMQVARGVWGVGKAVVAAPFGGGAVGGVGFALAHWTGELMGALGVDGFWCHAASAGALLVPGAVDAATSGAVTRLLETPAGRVASGIGYLYAATFAQSLVAFGVGRALHGGDDTMAYAARNHAIGEIVYANGLPWLLRHTGLAGWSDAVAAGEIPNGLDTMDRIRVAMGWMDPQQTAAAIREQVDARRAVQAKLATTELKAMLRALLFDAAGAETPQGLLERLTADWLGAVAMPAGLAAYDSRADQARLTAELVQKDHVLGPAAMEAYTPAMVMLGELYQKIRGMHLYRIDDPVTAALIAAFDTGFLEWDGKKFAEKGSKVLADPERLMTAIGGTENILQARRRCFYAVLANIVAKMAAEGVDLDDLRGFVDLAAAQPNGAGDLLPAVAVAGKDAEATIALLEWARAHGYLDDEGKIRPAADYYSAIEQMGRVFAAGEQPTLRKDWRQWALQQGKELLILLSQPDASQDQIRPIVDALRTLNVTDLFADSPKTQRIFARKLQEAEKRIKSPLSVGWEAIAKDAGPAPGPADAAKQAAGVYWLDEARKALALDVETQTGRPGLVAFQAAGDPFVWDATYRGLLFLDRPSLADVPRMLQTAVRADPMLAVQYALDSETGLPRSAAGLKALLMPTLRAYDKETSQAMMMLREPGQAASHGDGYRRSVTKALDSKLAELRKTLVPLFAQAVAQTGTLAARREWINAAIRHANNAAPVFRAIQRVIVLERQLGIDGHEGTVSEMCHTNGTIAHVTMLQEWLGASDAF